MKKKTEDLEMVVDGMPTEEETIVETEILATPTEVVPEPLTVTSSKTVQNGLTFYEVSAPINGKAKLVVKNMLAGLKVTIKLIDLTEDEFNNEELLKAKLIK